jgi:hypothetical protein
MDSEHLQVFVEDHELSYSIWNYKLVCISQAYWVFGLRPLSYVIKNTKKPTAG